MNLTRQSANVSRRRRSVSRERDDGATSSDDENAAAAAALRARSRRRRDASPATGSTTRPRRRSDRADHELLLAMPSLATGGTCIESRDLPVFVRTVVKNKPAWTFAEIDALARVTGAHSRRAASWDFEFGTLILDWWATKLPPRDSRPRALLQQPNPLTRDLIDAIVNARCEDNVYRIVVRAATLLYLLQGDSTPRDLKFAVTNCGARVELVTTNWTRMLLSDIEVIRVGGDAAAAVRAIGVACAQEELAPDLVDLSLDASARKLVVVLDNGVDVVSAAAAATSSRK